MMRQRSISWSGSLAAEKDLTLSGPARKARPILVIVDDVRLAQIIQNLVTNAVKATPEHALIEDAANASPTSLMSRSRITG